MKVLFLTTLFLSVVSGCASRNHCKVVAYWEKDFGDSGRAKVEVSLFESYR